MKTIATPKEILGYTTNINAKHGAIERYRADIARAQTATEEADRLAGEIEAVSHKRAEQKAMAFVNGTKADLAELDRQQEALERASRQAREDGVAAALAITMLETKITEAETVIAELVEQRKALTLEWLGRRVEAGVDRYLDALRALGPIIAEVAALDLVRNRVEGEFKGGQLGRYLLSFPRNVPIPYERQIPVPGRADGVRRTPIEWMGLFNEDLFKPEFEQLLAQLADAGVPT